MEMKTVVLTGGTGLVGMNLASALSAVSSPPRCLVRPASNVAHLLTWPVQARVVDFASKEDLARELEGAEVLIHAAYDPLGFDQVGVEPLYRAAGLAGVGHFIYFSTSAVHDIHSGIRGIREDDPPCLDSPYARFKHQEEGFLAEAREQVGVPWTVLRPGNVYGPWDLKGFMFRWFEAAAKGDVLLAGRGENRIHLCHVHNLVDITLDVALNEAAFDQVFFAADSQAEELVTVWRAIAKAFKQELRHLKIPLPVVRQLRRVTSRFPTLFASLRPPPKLGALSRIDYELSMDKVSQALGYESAVGFEDGIQATASWYRSFGVL